MAKAEGKSADKLSSELRQAKILQYFREGNAATADALGGQFSVSGRTVRNDIRVLNEELAGSGIIEGRNGEYVLQVFDRESFRLIYASLLETDERFNSSRNRRDYCLGRLMRSAEPVLTDELAYEMNIGRTTLIGDLKKLREELEPYRIRIEGRTAKGLVLEGGEFDIRVFVLENCFDAIYQDYPLDEEIVEILENRLKQQGYERDLRQLAKKYLILMLDRFLTGHFIGRLPDRYYNLTARREFARVDLLTNQIADFLHTGIPIEEKVFLMLPLVGMRTPTDFGKAYEIELDEQTAPLLEKIFDEISERLDINLDKEAFAEELAYHLMFMVNRIRFGIPLSNPLLADIRQKYPLAYRMAEIAGEIIEKEVGEPVSADETGHLASYFGIYLEEAGLSLGREFAVAVVCGSGRVTAKLILVQLKKVLDPSVTVDLYSDEKANPAVLNDYDLILTTLDLPYALEVPVIRIREIFDEKELVRQIEKVRVYGDLQVSLEDANRFVLEEFLDESLFFRFEEDYYEAALAKMAQVMVGQHRADASFFQRLLLREQKGTMVFENGVALPHTTQTVSPKMGLAVGVFANEVSYAGKEVAVIFLMAVPEQTEEDELLLRLYDEIINISGRPSMLAAIRKAKSYREFLRALRQ